MKKLLGCIFWLALVSVLCLMVLAVIGVAAQHPASSHLFNNF